MAVDMRDPVVDRSIKVTARLPSTRPLGPNTTLCTMSGVGRLTRTVSAADATSAGLAARRAPRATRGAIAASLLSNTVRL